MRRLLTALVLGLATAANGAAQEWAVKMFEKTSHDFGGVARNAKVEHRFKFKNLYKEDVHVAGVRVSCGCTTAAIVNPTLKTYESGEIVADYNTRSFLGHKEATITVTFDKPFFAEVRLQVFGNIRSDVSVEPGVVQFGTISQGTGAEKKVAVRYTGDDDWKIVDVTSAHPEYYEVETVPVSKARGNVAYDLVVRIKKDAPPGYLNDPLTLVTSDKRSPKIPVYVEGRIVPDLSVSPAALSLGVLKPGQKVTKLLVVEGKSPFKITAIDCDGGDCYKFKFDDAKSTQHRVPVTFTAGDKPGKVAHKIQIKTDRPGGKPLECQATATIEGA